jgi:hypothetical protein
MERQTYGILKVEELDKTASKSLLAGRLQGLHSHQEVF